MKKIRVKPPKAHELIKAIEAHLPLPLYPTPEVAHSLRQQGKDVNPDEALLVTSVLDSGEMGGILCVVKAEESNLMISLTHLRIAPDHPLRAHVVAYQKDRVRKLMQQR